MGGGCGENGRISGPFLLEREGCGMVLFSVFACLLFIGIHGSEGGGKILRDQLINQSIDRALYVVHCH